MLKIMKFELNRGVTVQLLSIPKYFQRLEVTEVKGTGPGGEVPTLLVLVDDVYPLELVDVWTFDVEQDLSLFPYLRQDMFAGSYKTVNGKDSQLVFL